jgi:cellulose biosynthesis protein BcsQ
MLNSDIYNKMYIFLGVNGAGKSHLLLSTARVLSAKGNNVLAIDTTKNQSMYSWFNYNYELEDEQALHYLKPIVRSDIDILADNPTIHVKVDYKKLESYNLNSYDFILIEGDESTNDEWLSKANKIFLVVNSEKNNIHKLAKMMKEKSKYIDKKNLNIVFNQYLDSKLNKDYVYNKIIDSVDDKFSFIDSTDIEIPFDSNDMITTQNNKMDGKIGLNNYSYDYKSGIFELVNFITPLSSKEFKNLKVK